MPFRACNIPRLTAKPLTTGVYCIRCVVTGKRYVGSAAYSFAERWKKHRLQLRGGRHHSRLLQRAWDKYGEAAFAFLVLHRCEPASCVGVEQLWMNAFRAADPRCGFNISPTAGSRLGDKATPETIAKIAAWQKSKVVSPETRARMSAALKGKKKSREHVEKMAAAHRGKKLTEEHRAQISAFNRGRKHSEETKAKIAAGNRGKTVSAEARAKLSAARKGKPLSEEHKLAMSIGIKASWARRKAKLEAANA